MLCSQNIKWGPAEWRWKCEKTPGIRPYWESVRIRSLICGRQQLVPDGKWRQSNVVDSSLCIFCGRPNPLYVMKYVLCCMLLYSCIGCSKLLYPVDVKADPISVFDYTVSNLQENYSFFELKGINWDSITKQYRRKVTASTTDPELYEVLNNLLGELKDGHVNLYTKMNKGRYWDWFNNYANNFNRNFVELTYLKKNYKIMAPLSTIG